MTRLEVIQNAKRIVIKVGSILLTDQETGEIKQSWIEAIAQDVSVLTKQGKEVIIVSSGGVALGRKALDIALNASPETIPLAKKQAASAVGQFHVFQGYHNGFSKLGITTAQVLLTMSETENRRMHLNARETLYTLLGKNIIPIINENDTISTEEIRFGDNDRLAVRVAQMVSADLVILLSTIDGLYSADPRKDKTATHFNVISEITNKHIKMAGDAVQGLSTGGMKSKLKAAITATRAGINLIIANGTNEHILKDLSKESDVKTTLFTAQENTGNARKRWIQSHMKPKGSVFIDDGCMDALYNGKSLLPIGARSVDGDFERGDAIEIKDQNGSKIGIGLSAYSASDARKLIGKQSKDIYETLGFAGRNELIHRDDMALDS